MIKENLGVFQGAFEFISRKNLKNIRRSVQNRAECSKCEFSFRVGFGAKTNLAPKQHGIDALHFLVIGWASLGFVNL